MKLPSSRIFFFLAGLFCAGLLVFAMFLEYVLGLDPCPLCLSQRIVLIFIAIIALLAILQHSSQAYRIYGAITALAAAGGMWLAGRQIWLQHLPEEQAPACMPGLDYLKEFLPASEIIKIMITGTGDCTEVQWTFLSLSIPSWTFIAFTGFLIFGITEVVRQSRPKNVWL
ncbi:Disulfide bond formation protein B [invertebrate metagenome]|uniref:Disulfide bond formation protein B n=1 Tax=invertebrate metagenome TaxID=1711999 RepID=A0A2H9TC85_9ZZZZ